MDYRRFNIYLKEAGGLNCSKLFFKRSVYAVVSIIGSSSSPSKQQTCVGKYNGTNPTWGLRSSLRFYLEDSELQQDHLVLMIQLMCKRILGSDKVIGEVYVPLKELYDNSGSTNHGFHQVVKPSGSGKDHGFLYFNYDFGEIIRGAVKKDNGAVAYPLIRTHSRVNPSAPCLEYLSLGL
ncbi:protein SRC2 [Gastrolobium bilobum]|uniref:protein SRC2 n=1 Tax=Gastrolobium bilobum TaxID=150636 RepID=UPI002AB2A0A6|nr:protein SRC2 [Gastrolobium bilobum]